MKSRKQKTAGKKRARRPARRRPAQRRSAAARKTAAAAGSAALALAAECTAAEADSLKTALVRLLEEPRSVTLKVGSLQRIDTAGLQLLAAFVRDRRTAGRRVEWRGRAPALNAAAGLLGLHSTLELPGEGGR
ncbi:MAG: STAS domain-containing protein [Steroidobacteraceae bacterium]